MRADMTGRTQTALTFQSVFQAVQIIQVLIQVIPVPTAITFGVIQGIQRHQLRRAITIDMLSTTLAAHWKPEVIITQSIPTVTGSVKLRQEAILTECIIFTV